VFAFGDRQLSLDCRVFAPTLHQTDGDGDGNGGTSDQGDIPMYPAGLEVEDFGNPPDNPAVVSEDTARLTGLSQSGWRLSRPPNPPATVSEPPVPLQLPRPCLTSSCSKRGVDAGASAPPSPRRPFLSIPCQPHSPEPARCLGRLRSDPVSQREGERGWEQRIAAQGPGGTGPGCVLGLKHGRAKEGWAQGGRGQPAERIAPPFASLRRAFPQEDVDRLAAELWRQFSGIELVPVASPVGIVWATITMAGAKELGAALRLSRMRISSSTPESHALLVHSFPATHCPIDVPLVLLSAYICTCIHAWIHPPASRSARRHEPARDR
jgi:hypothetical protein